MNRYKLTCEYCNNIWGVNYIPKPPVYCSKCKDSNIRIKDLKSEMVNYYEGCPDFNDPIDPSQNWNF